MTDSAPGGEAGAPEHDATVAVIDGFRFVAPYVYDFTAFVKHRWAGRALADALTLEYAGFPPEYVRWAIGVGLVTLDGAPCAPGVVLRQGQLLRQVVHRHEIPVPDAPLAALRISDHGALVSVCKPAGWPCHPGGAYRRNSLSELLREVAGIDRVSLLYRLDRVVSGVLLLVKGGGGADASAYVSALAHPASLKVYVARVAGRCGGLATPEVPPTPGEATVAAASARLAAAVSLRFPIVCLEKRRGVYDAGPHVSAHLVAASGKAAETTLVPLLYDATSDTTVALARPVTGRTHQLRVHLRAAGSPVANDPSYGPPRAVAEAHMRADARAVPLSWGVEARWVSPSPAPPAPPPSSLAGGVGALPPTCSLADLMLHCPFCARVHASAATAAADGGAGDAATAGGGAELGGDGSDPEADDAAGGLAAISVRPRPFRIWLHALAYRIAAATGLPPPLEFHADVPDWVPPAAVELVRATMRAWLQTVAGGAAGAPTRLAT